MLITEIVTTVTIVITEIVTIDTAAILIMIDTARTVMIVIIQGEVLVWALVVQLATVVDIPQVAVEAATVGGLVLLLMRLL